MLAKTKTSESVPLIFLITDGTVEDERHICNEVKSRLSDGRSICPRISTFGIGENRDVALVLLLSLEHCTSSFLKSHKVGNWKVFTCGMPFQVHIAITTSYKC